MRIYETCYQAVFSTANWIVTQVHAITMLFLEIFVKKEAFIEALPLVPDRVKQDPPQVPAEVVISLPPPSSPTFEPSALDLDLTEQEPPKTSVEVVITVFDQPNSYLLPSPTKNRPHRNFIRKPTRWNNKVPDMPMPAVEKVTYAQILGLARLNLHEAKKPKDWPN